MTAKPQPPRQNKRHTITFQPAVDIREFLDACICQGLSQTEAVNECIRHGIVPMIEARRQRENERAGALLEVARRLRLGLASGLDAAAAREPEATALPEPANGDLSPQEPDPGNGQLPSP